MTLKHEDGTLSLWARCGKRGQDALVIQGPLCELVRTQRARIFAVTWLAYAAFYLCRKNLSVAIPALEASGVFTRYQLADILFAYSLAYTAGQLFGGSLSDRFSPRRLVTTGMLLSAAATFAMGFSGLYSPFIALAVINGAGQSMGWPGLVKNMASWFDATPAEQAALFDLLAEVRTHLDATLHPAGYNLGINVGEAAGQTVMHLHVHLIPRFDGDVDDPRGGVRFVIPSRGNYRRPGHVPQPRE